MVAGGLVPHGPIRADRLVGRPCAALGACDRPRPCVRLVDVAAPGAGRRGGEPPGDLARRARAFRRQPVGRGVRELGALASSFLLPAGVEVRTLVNSHLTLLVEMGWPCGCAWLAFVASALACGRALPRTWIAFGGLALSACASSVFDWHVLFSADGMAGCGWLNRGLFWLLLAGFLSLGLLLLARGFRPLRALCATGGVLVAAAAVTCLWPTGVSRRSPRAISGTADPARRCCTTAAGACERFADTCRTGPSSGFGTGRTGPSPARRERSGCSGMSPSPRAGSPARR